MSQGVRTVSRVTTLERASRLLHEALGPAAEFRPGQLEAIEALVEQRERVLVVQRTGWGKSLVYLIATRLLRDHGAGPTLVVSPLLALMRNQVEMADGLGVRSATINSGNVDDWQQLEAAARDGAIDLLLVSPERLNNPRFRENVLTQLSGSAGLFVVDEVHCISDWGHDFRPDYRRVSRVLDHMPRTVPVLGCTATANDRVVEDVRQQLGDDLTVIRGPLARDSLRLRVLDLPSQAQRLAWLARELPELPGTGIVYCLTIEDAHRVNRWLQSRGLDTAVYTGQTDADDRLQVEADLSANRVKAVVATSALGMGYDKPDLGFVVHFQSPGSPIAYYQQVGRAGRGVASAEVVLLRGHEDRDIQDWFIGTAFPDRADAEAVLRLLSEHAEPVAVSRIEASVNVRRTRLEAMLKILEVEGAVAREGSRWYRTAAPWAYDEERVDRVTAHRRAEQQAMVDYGETDRCLMAFLLDQLDDEAPELCGRCANCTPMDDPPLGEEQVAEAVDFLRRQPVTSDPRRQWPAGLEDVRGRIPPEEQVAGIHALCLWADAGWGRLVQRGKYDDGHFDDRLVAASAELLARWDPQPAPTWVTAVPSRRHPELVPDFSRRLADALGLPFEVVLTKLRDTPPQKEMQNSAQQAANLIEAFSVSPPVPAGAVLLVDDVVDSRWTATVLGAQLRRAGAEAVHVFALARASGS